MVTSAERLQRIWETPHELALELATVDHKKIGERYLFTAFGFFLMAGLMAMVMRIQLAQPNENVVAAERYDQLFTMHGTLMIFFFATPILSGFGNFLLPLMIGSRDMAFPRLNAFGYWTFLFAGLFMLSSFLIGRAPDGGWFAYVPLTGPAYSPNVNLDFWVIGLLFLAISSTSGAANFIVTIFKMRAPGMSVNRLPLFVWSLLATSFALMFALPPLTAGNLMQLSDRKLGTAFFNPLDGGNPLLWQHLFWFFGHPDVYIIFLPAVGIVSTIVPVFSRRPIASYILVVLSAMTTGFIGFGVWVHHMFAVGLPQVSLIFFSAASMFIALPSGVQVFAWIATIWHGRPVYRPPFLFMLGFLIIFVMGGITGVMFAVIPFDLQATDSYFVVAHFHYVLFGGAVFPIFGGLYYWLPKITGRMLSDRLGAWVFALIFVGFNLTFFPQHLAGLAGMPRRIYTYDSGLGWTAYSLASTIGSFVLGAGILLFMYDYWRSRTRGAPAGNDPWGGSSLEWSTTSPPPAYNFAVIPEVHSREPLWDEGGVTFDSAGPSHSEQRETPATTVHDAEPTFWLRMPEDSLAPLILAFGLLVVAYGLLPDVFGAKLVLLFAGGLFVIAGFLLWFWPETKDEAAPETDDEEQRGGIQSTGWWGMALLVLTEAVLFGSLISAYFYTRSGVSQWPIGGIEKPELLIPAIGTVVLLGSSIPMLWAEASIKHGNQTGLRFGLLLSFLMGVVFLGLQAYEYSQSTFSLKTNVYGSLFFGLTGLHGLHVFGALLLNGFIQVRAWLGHFSRERHLAVANVALYWHFVDVVWILILGSVYLSPHLLPS